MSTGLPYLQKLRKSDLSEFAETTKLPNHSGLKKSDLEVALDDHLRSNATTYSTDPTLSEYYKRLGSTSKSPAKKLVEKVTEMVKSDDEAPAPAKKQRRKTTSAPGDKTETTAPSTAVVKTPAKDIARRTSILSSQIPMPPSPAVVTDAIDQQTRRLRKSISHAYNRTQITAYADSARDLLSSPLTVSIFATLLEAYALRGVIIPNKLLTELPAVRYVKSTKTQVNVPDLFLLLNVSFWAPFSLWLLTSLILPGLVAYFINLPLKAGPVHNTRRVGSSSSSSSSTPQQQFDPFIFNIAKGLLAYLVYAQHFQLGGLYQHFTVATVNESLLGGYTGILTSSGIGAAVSLYDAVLKK